MGTTYNVALTEKIGGKDTQIAGLPHYITLTEKIGVKDTKNSITGTNHNVTLTEKVGCKDAQSQIIGTHQNITLTEKVGCKDSQSYPIDTIISLDTIASTLPTVLIDGTDYSNYVQRIEMWLKATEGVGRFQISYFNQNQALENIAPKASVAIYNKQYPMMKGYVDIPESMITEDYQTKGIPTFATIGRDLGRNLQMLIFNKFYMPMLVEALLQDVFANSGTSVSLAAPTSTNPIYYQPNGKYLLDIVREVLELVDYDGFVHTNNVLRIFPHDGSSNQPSSDLTLKSVANDPTSNIIKLVDRNKGDVTDLKNYIVTLLSLSNVDVFTELNASDWKPAATQTTVQSIDYPVDFTGTPPIAPTAGVASIELPKASSGYCGGRLVFPLYGISKIDYSQLTEPESITFEAYAPVGAGVQFDWSVILTDDAGNQIQWFSNTVLSNTGTWTSLSMASGASVVIYNRLPAPTYDAWNYYGSSTTFNWRIVSFEFVGYFVPSISGASYVLIDNLQIPGVTPVAVAYWANANPIDPDPTNYNAPYTVNGVTYPHGFGKEQWLSTRSDFGTFREANDYSQSIYQKRKAPLDKITLWIKGDAAFVAGQGWMTQPGYKVNVTVDQWNLTNGAYRFMEVHHILDRLSPELGWNHRVELSLVPVAQKLQTQVWSYGQNQGAASVARALRDRLTALEVKARAANNWYSSLP